MKTFKIIIFLIREKKYICSEGKKRWGLLTILYEFYDYRTFVTIPVIISNFKVKINFVVQFFSLKSQTVIKINRMGNNLLPAIILNATMWSNAENNCPPLR